MISNAASCDKRVRVKREAQGCDKGMLTHRLMLSLIICRLMLSLIYRAAPSTRSHEDGTLPPDLILFYAQFNATEMRQALDAPELPRSWIAAHQEDDEILRKEVEEEAEQATAEEAAQKVAFPSCRVSLEHEYVDVESCVVAADAHVGSLAT
jgi:hypothetical protein